MKSARIFLTGMYLHLVLSICTPIAILAFSDGWDTISVRLLCLYLVTIAAVQLTGWICVLIAAIQRHRQPHMVRKGWKLLKLWSIPFYLLNFVYSVFAWFILLGASRGMIFFLLPLPIVVTCLMIFQSGCVGICHLLYLKKQPENGKGTLGIHFLLQLLPVTDVISTIILLRRYPVENKACSSVRRKYHESND